jgi:1-deoxy-D-xylulose-5-phosphate synthase
MSEELKYEILFKVKYPSDIRDMSIPELKTLCADIRKYMVDVISKIGGHFGRSGATELTVALHKVFDTPHDKIIWDTGHQAYPHKILTGRKELLPTIRQLNGISGFLKRSESEYDAFGAGHASTSISAGWELQYAALQREKKQSYLDYRRWRNDRGMAYEAMNNTGVQKSRPDSCS